MQTIQNCAFYYHSSGPVSFSLTTTGVSQERTHGTSFRLSVLPSCSHRELFSGSMHRWERTQRAFFFLTGDQKQGAVLMPKIQHSGDLGRGTAVSWSQPPLHLKILSWKQKQKKQLEVTTDVTCPCATLAWSVYIMFVTFMKSHLGLADRGTMLWTAGLWPKLSPCFLKLWFTTADFSHFLEMGA